MNKRQRKKLYQQRHGYSPGEEDHVQQMIRDMIEYADRRPAEVKKERVSRSYSSFLAYIKQRNQRKRKEGKHEKEKAIFCMDGNYKRSI